MEPDGVILSWKKMEPGTREALLMLGALLLVIFLVFIWAAFLRRRRRHHHHHHDHSHHQAKGSGQESAVAQAKAVDDSPKRRKWRRPRRPHRPRNPTLAETGGLPPVRPDGPPPAP